MRIDRTIVAATLGFVFSVSSAFALITHPGTYPSLQAAIAAASPGEEVRINNGGTFSGNLSIAKSISLTASPTSATVNGTVTITGTSAVTVLLQGLIVDPNAAANGVAVVGAARVQIDSCTIKRALGEGTSAGGWHEQGHAIVALADSTLTVTDCLIDVNGGQCGVYAGTAVSLALKASTITGGVSKWANTVAEPHGSRASLVLSNNGQCTVENCLITKGGNGFDNRHVVFLRGNATGTFVHCTLWESSNIAAIVAGDVPAGATANLTLKNSILGGAPWISVPDWDVAGNWVVQHDHNSYYGYRSGTAASFTPDITEALDPTAANAQFFNAGANDFRLLPTSPACATAVDVGVHSDRLGNPRPAPVGSDPDRGCFEEQTYAGPYPVALKADYGFTTRTVTPADLGLVAKQVLKWNFMDFPQTDLPAGYKGTDYYDEIVLKSAMQGMVNRSSPMVWLDATAWLWGHAESQLQGYYLQRHGYLFSSRSGGVQNMIQKLAPVFNGVILYEPVPSDNIALAMNLANHNFCLPVSTRIYNLHKSSFGSLPVVVYIRQNRMSRTEVYDWLTTNILPLADKGSQFNCGATFTDITLGADWRYYCLGFDYPFLRKSLITNMSCLSAPEWHSSAQGNISGTPEMAAQFAHFLESLDRPAMVTGWMEPEYYWCKAASEKGHSINATVASNNLSFHAGVTPISPPPYIQDTTTRKRLPEQKVYLAFLSNESDNLVVDTTGYYRAWFDPQRGQVPLSWGMAPQYAQHFPALMEYYWTTKTSNDYFSCPPSGAGYMYPMFGTYLNEFAAFTSQMVTGKVTEREIGIWQASDANLESYARNVPTLRGITCIANGGTYGTLTKTAYRKVPILRYADRLNYWMTDSTFFPGGTGSALDVAAFKTYMDAMYANNPKPFYCPFYGLQDNLIPEIMKVKAALDPAKFEIIDLGTMAHLAGLPAGTVDWNPSMLQNAAIWSVRMNGAIVSANSGGLRVEVAPGKNWAVAAIPNCLLPADARFAKVNVTSLVGAAQWVVKLSEDWTGPWVDTLPFGVSSATGESTAPVGSEVLAEIDRLPLNQLQIGIQGPAGSSVTVESFEFSATNPSGVPDWSAY